MQWHDVPRSSRIITLPGRKFLRVWKSKVYHQRWDCPDLVAEMPSEPHQVHEAAVRAGGYRACSCVEDKV